MPRWELCVKQTSKVSSLPFTVFPPESAPDVVCHSLSVESPCSRCKKSPHFLFFDVQKCTSELRRFAKPGFSPVCNSTPFKMFAFLNAHIDWSSDQFLDRLQNFGRSINLTHLPDWQVTVREVLIFFPYPAKVICANILKVQCMFECCNLKKEQQTR